MQVKKSTDYYKKFVREIFDRDKVDLSGRELSRRELKKKQRLIKSIESWLPTFSRLINHTLLDILYICDNYFLDKHIVINEVIEGLYNTEKRREIFAVFEKDKGLPVGFLSKGRMELQEFDIAILIIFYFKIIKKHEDRFIIIEKLRDMQMSTEALKAFYCNSRYDIFLLRKGKLYFTFTEAKKKYRIDNYCKFFRIKKRKVRNNEYLQFINSVFDASTSIIDDKLKEIILKGFAKYERKISRIRRNAVTRAVKRRSVAK